MFWTTLLERILSANPAMERMSGIPEGEQVGRPALDFMPEVLAPEDQTIATGALTEALEGSLPRLPP